MLTTLTTVGEEDQNSSFTNPQYITFEGSLFHTHWQSDLPRLTNVYLTKKAFGWKKKVTTNSLSSFLTSQLDITPALQKYLDSCVSSKHCHGKRSHTIQITSIPSQSAISKQKWFQTGLFIRHLLLSQTTNIHAITRVIPFNLCKWALHHSQALQIQKHTQQTCSKQAPIQSPFSFTNST